MRTLHGTSALLANLLSVTGVTLSEAQKSLNRALVILVALHLNNHLLETPDGLLAALLGHLALEVVVELITTGSGLLLILFGDLLAELLLALLKAALCIQASVVASLALVSTELGDVTWITRPLGVGSLAHITGDLLCILLANGYLLLDSIPEVALGEVGVLVPSVLFSRLINLAKSFLRRSNLVGSVLSSVASDVAEKSGSVG